MLRDIRRVPSSRLGKCNSKRFLSLMQTLELSWSRVRKVVVGMTDGKLRGIGTERKRVERERRFFLFCFQPP